MHFAGVWPELPQKRMGRWNVIKTPPRPVDVPGLAMTGKRLVHSGARAKVAEIHGHPDTALRPGSDTVEDGSVDGMGVFFHGLDISSEKHIIILTKDKDGFLRFYCQDGSPLSTRCIKLQSKGGMISPPLKASENRGNVSTWGRTAKQSNTLSCLSMGTGGVNSSQTRSMNDHDLLTNVPLECQVIGWLLRGGGGFRTWFPQLALDIFTDSSCRKLMSKLQELFPLKRGLYDRKIHVSDETLSVCLEKLAEEWGCDVGKQNVQPSGDQFENAIRLLNDLAQRREWLKLLDQARARLFMLNYDIPSAIQKSAEQSKNEDAQRLPESNPVTIDALIKILQEAESWYERKGMPLGVTSGLRSLDSMTMGFQPGRFYLILGAQGAGKTTLFLTMLGGAIKERRAMIGVSASKESQMDLMRPLFYQRANTDLRNIGQGYMAMQDFDRMTETASSFTKGLDVRCIPDRTLADVGTQIESLGCVDSGKILFVDDIQCLGSDLKSTCRELQELARTHQVPIVAFGNAETEMDVLDTKPNPKLFELPVDCLGCVVREGEKNQLRVLRNVGLPLGDVDLEFDPVLICFHEPLGEGGCNESESWR